MHSPSQSCGFVDCINDCGLIDLGFKVRIPGKIRDMANIAERLDRSLANNEWRRLYPDAVLTHLPILGSDHAPIILHFHPRVEASKKPFRFEAMWLNHPDPDLINVVYKARNLNINGSKAFKMQRIQALGQRLE